MEGKLSMNQLKTLSSLSSPEKNWHGAPEKGFSEIKEWFSKNNLSISDNGLSKILIKLREGGYVKKFVNSEGKMKYRITTLGANHLQKYYWPLIDTLSIMDREKSLYFMFSHFGSDYHYIEELGQRPGTSYVSYYTVPLPNEFYYNMLSTMAVKLVSGELDNIIPNGKWDNSDERHDIYLTTHYNLAELNEVAETFWQLWSHAHSDIESLTDIVAHLISNKSKWIQRDLFSSMATMLVSTSVWLMNKSEDAEMQNRVEELDKKLGEIFLNRMDLTSDLDKELIEIFIEDIEAEKDPLEDERVMRNKLILEHEYEGFNSYMMQDYVRGAAIKKGELDFIVKAENYLKGTQGILIRTLMYQQGK